METTERLSISVLSEDLDSGKVSREQIKNTLRSCLAAKCLYNEMDVVSSEIQEYAQNYGYTREFEIRAFAVIKGKESNNAATRLMGEMHKNPKKEILYRGDDVSHMDREELLSLVHELYEQTQDLRDRAAKYRQMAENKS